jgi:hypothetical protein
MLECYDYDTGMRSEKIPGIFMNLTQMRLGELVPVLSTICRRRFALA